MFHVYVLLSSTKNNRYIGFTGNLEKRIRDHNFGESRYTKNRGPWKLIYTEEFNLRSDAMSREKFLKSGKGREFLNSLTE